MDAQNVWQKTQNLRPAYYIAHNNLPKNTLKTAQKKFTFPYKMNISWAGLTLADSTQENIMQKSKK